MMSQKLVVVRPSKKVAVVASASPLRLVESKTRTRVRARTRRSQPGLPNQISRSYAQTLNDPFEHGGFPLGYDCFLPTTQMTGFVRNSFVVNADGSFAVYFTPDITRLAGYNTAAFSATPTVNWTGASNQTAIQQTFGMGRVVSGGARCIALVPSTAVPGVLFSGTTPDYSYSSFSSVGATTVNLCGFAGSEIGLGSKGATVLTRPFDNKSYEMGTRCIFGFAANEIPPTTCGYIAGQGFPAGTVIWYEAILHLECIARTNSLSLAAPSDELPTAAQSYSSPGDLWRSVRGLLSSPVILDFALSALGAAGTAAAGRVARQASRFGGGSAYERSIRSHSRQLQASVSDGYIHL